MHAMASYFTSWGSSKEKEKKTEEYSSDEETLAQANSYMKPGVGDKYVIAPQLRALRDISESFIQKGNDPYLFLKDKSTRKSLVVKYTGEQAVEGEHPGDFFEPDTIRRCHLTEFETLLFEEKFHVKVDGVVSLTKHKDRNEWRQRLLIYYLLLESNMFSESVDVTGEQEKQEFLYRFAMLKSPLQLSKVAKIFGKEVGDFTLQRASTTLRRRKRRKLSTKDLLGVTSRLGMSISTLAPIKPFTVAQGLKAASQLGLPIVTLGPVGAPAGDTAEAPFTVAQGLDAAKQLGLPIVTLEPVKKFTVAQGLVAASQLGLPIVTLKPG